MIQLMLKSIMWIKEHNLQWYAMFYIVCAYILSAYELSLLGWYNDNVMPILQKFVPSVLSFIIVLFVISFTLYNIGEKIRNRYQYDGKMIALIGVVIVIIVRYRICGQYVYAPWLWFISYVDILAILLSSYVIVFLWIAFLKYRDVNKRNESNGVFYESMTILRDCPIQDKSEDILNQHDEAVKIALEINKLDRKRSWSFAITAPWGTGKTSFLNLVVKEISKKDFEIIYFNPRDSKSYETIQMDFFNELACTLAKYNSRCSGTIKNYMASLQLIDNRGIIERLANFYKIWDKKSLKDRIRVVLSGFHKKILVLIDDFDRLSRDEILEVLKLIDGNAAFDNVVFLTAYDKEQVNKILGAEYQTKDACFVDKFFNLEYMVPCRPYYYILEYLKKKLIGILDVNEEDKESIINSINWNFNIYKSYLPTLRDVKRFINQVSMDFGGVRGEVKLNEFMLLHLIKYKYREEFNNIHRLKYIERGGYTGDNNVFYLKQDIDEGSEIYPILSILFNKKGDDMHETYRHVCSISSFEYYFVNQVFDSLRLADMMRLLGDKFDIACKKIDTWIISNKYNDLIVFMDNYNINSLSSSNSFIQYAKILAYMASKEPKSRAYQLFLNVIEISFFNDHVKKFKISCNNYKSELLSVITNSFNKPDFLLLQQLHSNYKTKELDEKLYLITDSDIWQQLKYAFLERLEIASVCNETMSFFYRCIDHMEPSRRIVLDKDCLKAMRKAIEKAPYYYLRPFVRLKYQSSNPQRNAIACEPFWNQLFGDSSAMEAFIQKCLEKNIEGSCVANNFWQLFKANKYEPIEFENQGDVQEKITNGLVEEAKILDKLQHIKREVENIPSNFENLKEEKRTEYRDLLNEYMQKIEDVKLNVFMKYNVREDVKSRLSKLT